MSTVTNCAPIDSTCSATSGRTSKARTIAPSGPPRRSPPARDAGADDEDPRRRHLAGRRDLAGEQPAELVGRLDHRAVAGDVGHRATARPSTARGRCAAPRPSRAPVTPAAASRSTSSGLRAGAISADHRRAPAQPADLGVGRCVDLDHDVAGPDVLGARRRGRRPRSNAASGWSAADAGAGLDDHVVAERGSCAAVFGVAATRVSPGRDSRGMPILMGVDRIRVGADWLSRSSKRTAAPSDPPAS